MKNILYTLALLFVSVLVTAQTTTENYIKSTTAQVPVTTEAALNALPADDKIETITYFDGLGRPIQSIAKQAGGDREDIITPMVYDQFGRQIKDYLPYARSNSSLDYELPAALMIDLNNQYLAKYASDLDANLPNPFSEKVLEASPLNRVLEQAAPGQDWAVGNGHTIKFDYQTNEIDEVRLFTVTHPGGNTEATQLVDEGHYNAYTLYKTITKDENWTAADGNNHTTEEFKNKQGQVVLKRTYNDNQAHDTYYVYDDYGNLSFVLPPEGTDMISPSGTIDTTALDGLCYQYHYDGRNRLIEKKIPGKGWEHIVYDKLDRPVMTQDAVQREDKQWLFTKYDAFGRVVYTGLWQSGPYFNPERSILQQTMDVTTNPLNEERLTTPINVGGATLYYTNQSELHSNVNQIYTVNYYDDYEVGNLIVFNPANGSGTWEGMTATANVKGLPTVSQVRILDSSTGSGQTQWTTTATYYDELGRPWETHVKNDYLNTEDWVLNKLDFTGKVLKTATNHTKDGNSIDIVDTYTYDHVGRLLTQIQTVSPLGGIQGAPEQIVKNHYDDLGQLSHKNVGGDPNTTGLQRVDYQYNIRGWLTSVNNGAVNGTDLFGFRLRYTDHIQAQGESLYNGNISEMEWRSANDNKIRRYTYHYDDLNRITKANFSGQSTNGVSVWANYRLDLVSYDKNGNILGLRRRGLVEADVNYDNIDLLSYTYAPKSNQLLSVSDTKTSDGFNDGNTVGNDYAYDVNGNMTEDLNKGIEEIHYNHLNLPTEVGIESDDHEGVIEYVYDATGVKLAKLIEDITNNSHTTTEYAGGFIYENGQLKMFPTAEGYVELDANGNGNFNYVYQYKDHLGNIRLTYADSDGNNTIDASTEIIEEKNYYPFGLQHKGYNVVINGQEFPYKFNGKEHQEELGLNTYDFGARNYDPAIGRWFNIDPMADKMRSWSPYNFAFNNPMLYVDPDGMFPIIIHLRSFAPFKTFGPGMAWGGRVFKIHSGRPQFFLTLRPDPAQGRENHNT